MSTRWESIVRCCCTTSNAVSTNAKSETTTNPCLLTQVQNPEIVGIKTPGVFEKERAIQVGLQYASFQRELGAELNLRHAEGWACRTSNVQRQQAQRCSNDREGLPYGTCLRVGSVVMLRSALPFPPALSPVSGSEKPPSWSANRMQTPCRNRGTQHKYQWPRRLQSAVAPSGSSAGSY